MYKDTTAIFLLAMVLFGAPAAAHHGVASLGVAGLEGPGAPVESSNSVTLPVGDYLIYTKLDYASYEKFTPERDDEGQFAAYWMYGLGYGFTPYLSGYIFVPFYSKVVEDNSYNTAGFADLSLMGVFGFKYDEGLRLVPDSESLDDMQDWHFTVYGGLTLPTGNPNLKDSEGDIDPGMSLGFGKPAFMAGFSATKQLTGRNTVVFDIPYFWFQEYEYDDGSTMKFGAEFRANLAWVLKMYTNSEAKFRFDGIIEANYLDLGRDVADGIEELATGGQMLYLQPGIRLYKANMSTALGLKLPVWKDLNEEDFQQGAEGTEEYRLEFTLSILF
jgi:hypothetical protein